jgi:hypothetical protein
MSDALPEPTNVGPIAGGNIRASDADREQVANVLNTAYAEGRLSREEHDERLSQLMAAKTFDDLIPITHDLVVTRRAPSTPAAAPNTAIEIDPVSASDEPNRLVAIFGGVSRTGRWRIRKKNQAVAVFGSVDLDLQDAVFEGPTIEMSSVCCFGSLDIKVPPGMQVRNEMAAIFGDTSIKYLGDPIPGAPTLVIKGMTLFGGVTIRGPKPGRKRH